jgi:hypothetical protein
LQDELRMPANQAAELVTEQFTQAWAEEYKLKGAGGKDKPSLLRALRKSFGAEVLVAAAWKITWSVFVLVGAFYFVRSLVQFVTPVSSNGNMYNRNTMPNNGVGWILSAMFFLDSVLVGIALQRMGDACVRSGIKLRAALMAAVYRKSFHIHHVHEENVVSLVSTDCAKLYEGVMHLQNVWTAPIEATAIIALLLYLTDGTYGLPALGVVVFILPLQVRHARAPSTHAWGPRLCAAPLLRMPQVDSAAGPTGAGLWVWRTGFRRWGAAGGGDEVDDVGAAWDVS